jgi:plastocyanin
MGARLSALLAGRDRLGRGWSRGGGLVRLAALAVVIAYAASVSNVSVANAADPPPVTIGSTFPFQFSQTTLNVDVGGTVKWNTTTGAAPHTITSDGCANSAAGPCTFDSGMERLIQATGARTSYEFKFNNPGVYAYFCRLHGAPGGIGQAGTIIVGSGGAPAATASQLRPNVSAVVYSPREGQTIAGDRVNVSLGINGATLRAPVAGTTDNLYGHFNLILDATVDQTVQIGAGPSVTRSNTREAVLEGVRPGAHTLTAVWTYDNNVPPQPPIVWTVRFTTTGGPAGPVAAGGPGAGPIAPPRTGDGGLAGSSTFALWQLLIAPAIIGAGAFTILRRARNGA